ncbi:MAG TPA: class I SAM-dependent methyltransferase [Alphaproteobacteria bacterium]|nr:class I SAM-dependent methyltransferase [Alphaproteobacteria bacterium]
MSDDPGQMPQSTTHFGFREVSETDKAGLVRQVFDSVAGRYDLMNDLMSAGVHRLWKSTLLDMIDPAPGQRLLDVAGGTGDIALGFLERAGGVAGQVHVAICDVNPAMAAIGRDRALDRGMTDGATFVVGDAERLPFADSSVDVYTIGFGLRNVTRPAAALTEARRVLRPGGRFFCLEFSRVVLPVLDRIYDLYSFAVLPRLGELVAGDRAAYEYLVQSIRRFPAQEDLAGLMAAANFDLVRWRNLSGGIAAIHSGWRI